MYFMSSNVEHINQN